MKKVFFIIICSLVLFGCNSKKGIQPELAEEDRYPTEFSVANEDFQYTLKVGAAKYQVGDELDITATLTYIGDQNEISISHAASPFYFELEEQTRDYTIDYPMNAPLIITVLKNGETIEEKYSPSGGYSDQDSPKYVDFIKAFLAGDYPKGDYVVEGFVDFWINEPSNKVNLKGNVQFEIVE